jgi:hypothetical protein
MRDTMKSETEWDFCSICMTMVKENTVVGEMEWGHLLATQLTLLMSYSLQFYTSILTAPISSAPPHSPSFIWSVISSWLVFSVQAPFNLIFNYFTIWISTRLLRLWVRIPPGAWIFICCECCMLSGRGLYDELITRPKESYRLVCRCVWPRNLKNGEAMTRVGPQRHGGGGNPFLFMFIPSYPASLPPPHYIFPGYAVTRVLILVILP